MDTMEAFAWGYEQGALAAKAAYRRKRQRKININHKASDNDGALEIVRLDTGALMNLGGRSLPF